MANRDWTPDHTRPTSPAPKPCACFARKADECACGAWDDLTNIYNHAAEVFAPLPDQFHRDGEAPNKTSPENK